MKAILRQLHGRCNHYLTVDDRRITIHSCRIRRNQVTAPFEAKDVSRTHSVLHNLKPRFLEGLTSYGLKSVLAAAKSRRIPPNSVIANQENPATHLFLLLTGRARCFFYDGKWTEGYSTLDFPR